MGRIAKKAHEKLEYVGRQFLSELGLGQWRGREFWGMLFILVIVFFIRMYLHYIGQWLLLNAFEIPINMWVHTVERKAMIRAQLFKANDIVSEQFVKIYIEWYANMLKFFAEKMWVAFAVQKLLTFF